MPNEYMVSSQFLYKLSTIYEVENNAFIVPLQDNLGRTLGLYPVSSTGSSIVTHNGVQYFRFEINNIPQAIEYKSTDIIKSWAISPPQVIFQKRFLKTPSLQFDNN